MRYVKFDNALTLHEANFIKDHILSDSFPWFYQERAIPKNKKYSSVGYPFMAHNLMLRAESKKREPGIVNSTYFDFFYEIFKRNCKTEHNFLLRMSLNLTFFHPEKHGDIHVDHDFNHSNMIIYLNQFSDGKTYLFNDKNEIVDEISPSLNTGCIFPGTMHAQGFCSPGESRLILIATFV